ncbi:MAG: M28 family metallopeptidase [bacterium]
MLTTHRLRRVIAALITVLLVAAPLLAGGGREQPTADATSSSEAAGQTLIRNTVDELAAPELAGRLTGSSGNRRAAELLAGKLHAAGLEALPGSETMLELYSQPVLRRDAPARMGVRASDGTATELEPGVDFQILIRHGATIGGTVETTVVTAPEDLNAEWISAQDKHVLLLDAQTFGGVSRDREVMGALFSPDSGPAAVILGMPPEADEMASGVFLTHDEYPAGGPMLVQTTAEVAEEIRALPEPEVEIVAGYRVESAEVANVVARVPVPGATESGDAGSQATGPPILLTAHFDGQGDAGEEVYYPGAVDNASGVAAVIEAARLLVEETPSTDRNSDGADAPLRRPVWVVLFNGEEQGLYGSRAFVAAHESDLDGATVVNIDMVGHSESAAFSVVATDAGKEPAAAVAELLKEAGFEADHGAQGRSDHLSFEGVAPAVSVVQAPYPHMHAPGDVATNVDAALVQRVAHAVAAYVRQVAGAGGRTM